MVVGYLIVQQQTAIRVWNWRHSQLELGGTKCVAETWSGILFHDIAPISIHVCMLVSMWWKLSSYQLCMHLNIHFSHLIMSWFKLWTFCFAFALWHSFEQDQFGVSTLTSQLFVSASTMYPKIWILFVFILLLSAAQAQKKGCSYKDGCHNTMERVKSRMYNCFVQNYGVFSLFSVRNH